MTEKKRFCFVPGDICPSVGAVAVAGKEELSAILMRHLCGDWGEIDPEDARENDKALQRGQQLMGVYRTLSRELLYVVTPGDRSRTSIMTAREL